MAEAEKPLDEAAAAPAALAGAGRRLRDRLAAVPTPLLLGVAALLVLAVAGTVAVLPLLLGVDQEDLEALGYPGVFLANFLGTATLFFPVPGLTAGGQLLIATLARTLNPVGVALLGGLGMATAEVTAYLAGRGLREVSSQRPMPIGGPVGRALSAIARWVDRLMMGYGVPTLFVLSAVPNPFFEFAGITAGAVRMAFWRFFLPVLAGKMVRAFLLAFVGERIIDLLPGPF
ncbi:MAG: VTT domain-containing protein [Dehalococcoidia bacterium]|nr:VTT domain-containing protein [Dehalococcoidia bacterium]MDW8009555.1 VTT domain-containing protein [Chloroflexota bacterium]